MTDTIGPTKIYAGHEAPNESRVYAGRLDDDRDQATPDEAQDDEPKEEQ
jgi:hypothetical protein